MSFEEIHNKEETEYQTPKYMKIANKLNINNIFYWFYFLETLIMKYSSISRIVCFFCFFKWLDLLVWSKIITTNMKTNIFFHKVFVNIEKN